MRISIVIPAFNNWNLTSRCVETLRRTTSPELVAEIIVVDDASNDGVTAAWTAEQQGITPILLGPNRGFSGACNAGAARSTGDAVLFLNNDAFMRPGTLQILRDTLAADETIGIVGARLLYSDGSLQHAGLALLPGSASRWWHVHKRQSEHFADAQIARDLFAVTGAALLIRRSLFTELGGFDEGFINGWEDVDLCLRSWCLGSRVRYEPSAVLDHLESATLGHDKNHERNEQRFINRWEVNLARMPRYPLPEVPPIALAVRRNAAADERWALSHIDHWWKTHLGASVSFTRPASRLDRVRVDLLGALARRLPTLEISWNEACLAPPTGAQRVAFVTPRSAAEAATYSRARGVRAWWTPTEAARQALCDAGTPADNVTVVWLGAETLAPPIRNGKVTVAATSADAPMLERLVREVPAVRTSILALDTRPSLADIDIVLIDNGRDRFGLLVQAALGQGCSVVITRPIDDQIALATGVTVVDDELVFDALRSKVLDIENVRDSANELYLDARRRLDAYLATQHVAELARALTGGSPSTSSVEMTHAYAQRFLRHCATAE